MPPQNGGVRFENQGEEFGAPPDRSGGFDLSALFVKWGIVSSPKEAQVILITIAIIAALIAVFFFVRSGGSNTPPPPPPHMAPAGAY